uniref:Chitin-binding type-2 domain-containing protein n=1 Tax=Magallana gigas TaxID=29159 RepID=A0A8W8MPD2_MAGGI
MEINHTLLPTMVQEGRWQISVSHPHRRIRILRDPVKCGYGYFRITLIQKPNKIYPSDVNIQIEIQLEVGQSEADGQYQITCSSTSDCTPAPITLLGSLGNKNQDKYYSDPKFCNIFHRCVNERLYTAPCGKGTYFSTKTCACSHINDVIGENSCNTDGLRLKGGNDKELCTDSTRR